jgi:prefoldin alpha subunit
MSQQADNTTAAAGGSGSNNNTIQLDTMSLDQLDQLQQREESRLQALSGRYAALRQAAARLSASQTAVLELGKVQQQQQNNQVDISSGGGSNAMDTTAATTSGEDSAASAGTTGDVFVPLTESVYIPGKLALSSAKDDANNSNKDLLVELGTGYFIEQSPTEAVNFLQRKLAIVDANSDNSAL